MTHALPAQATAPNGSESELSQQSSSRSRRFFDGSLLMQHIWPHTDIGAFYNSLRAKEVGLEGSVRHEYGIVHFDGRERPSARSRTSHRVDCGAFALWAFVERRWDSFFDTTEKIEERLDQLCTAAGIALPTHLVADLRGDVTAYWCTDSYMAPERWSKAHAALFDMLLKGGLITYEMADTWEVDLGRALQLPEQTEGRNCRFPVPGLTRAEEPISCRTLLSQLSRYYKKSWPKLHWPVQ